MVRSRQLDKSSAGPRSLWRRLPSSRMACAGAGGLQEGVAGEDLDRPVGRAAPAGPRDAKRSGVDVRREEQPVPRLETAEGFLKVLPGMLDAAVSRAGGGRGDVTSAARL